MPLALTHGITYLNNGVLCVSLNSENPVAQSLVAARGAHYELPANWLADYVPQADPATVLAAIENAYRSGYEANAAVETELKGVVFAGQGDPLLALPSLAAVVKPLKTSRHGVPITVVSYGLVASSDASQVISQLVDMGVERLQLYFPASDPVSYSRLLMPQDVGFTDLCQFIVLAAEAGLAVHCFIIADHYRQAAELRTLATSLGAMSLEVWSYHA